MILIRTTISLEDEIYKLLANKSIEKYGTMRNMSQLINDMLKGGLDQTASSKKQDVTSSPISTKKFATKPIGINQGKIERYILESIEKKGGLLFTVIDPMDYPSLKEAVANAKNASEAGTDAILIGGSTGVQGEILDIVTKEIKSQVNVPVILFPGNIGTVTKYADAVYFMSMLNSRNPYWISGAQMLAAPMVKQYGVEPLSTGYIVIEPGGTVGYVGEANKIPRDKPMLAAALALGAQFMGFRMIITDAGSNPKDGHIPLEMVGAVSKFINVPYIVAGGVRTPEQARNVIAAGADAIQVGTAFEKGSNVEKIRQMVNAVRDGAKSRDLVMKGR